MLRCRPGAHAARAGKTNLQVKFHGVNPSSLLAAIAKGKKWTTFTPPAAALRRRYRGLILHRRSQLIRHTEDDFDLVGCVDCIIAPACGLTSVLDEALSAFLGVLDRYTLADVLARKGSFLQLLKTTG